MLLGTSGLLRSLSHLCKFFFSNRAFFFASPTANATFPPLSAISLGLFSGIWGRPIAGGQYGLLSPYFAIAQYGLLAPPISPVGLNTASRRGYVLVSLRAYAALSPYCRWQYGLLVPGLRFAHPGLCSGAPSGLMIRKPLRGYYRLGLPFPRRCRGLLAETPNGVEFPPRQINNARVCGRSNPHAKLPTPAVAGVHTPSPFMERGWPTGRG